jgi:hypothetical protein
MNERVHRALDGDLSMISLTPSELADVHQAEAEFDAVLRAVPVQPVPDLAPAVLRQIQRETTSDRARTSAPVRAIVGRSPRTLADWLWRRRSISIAWRPAYALAAAAVLAVGLASERLRPGEPMSPQVFTQFVLRAPDAKRVELAGDFTDWRPAYVMKRSEPGVWTVVVPLAPGVHTYSFVVDGERWVPDPAAPAVRDGFGGVNSRLAVLTPDVKRS